MVRIIAGLLLILTFVKPADASHNAFITSGSVRGRALALGGAYYSLEDDLSAGFYNPGAFRVNATRSERSFRVFLNPIGAATGVYDLMKYDLDHIEDDTITAREALRIIGTAVKGAVLSTSAFDIGFGLSEEVLPTSVNDMNSNRFFSFEQLGKNCFHSMFLNLKIAPTVSVGASTTAYVFRDDNEDNYRTGNSIGVLLNPNPKLKVGLTYSNFPNKLSNVRMGIESVDDETVTSGVSYYPDSKTVLSLDLRNLTSENDDTSREIHTGIERVFFSRIAMRAGYFREKTEKTDTYSVGVGILPAWEKISKFSTSSRTDLLSYTMVFENEGLNRQWHIVSLLLRY